MKLSEFIKKLQELQKEKGDISVPKNSIKAVYTPLYTKNYKGEFELSYDYLKSIDDTYELLDYLVMELEIQPTEKVIRAYHKAYENYHSSGQVEVYYEFLQLLDLLDIEYKDWD